MIHCNADFTTTNLEMINPEKPKLDVAHPSWFYFFLSEVHQLLCNQEESKAP